VRIYPNPTTGSFTVELKDQSLSGISKIEIYTMNGVRVLARDFNGVHKCELQISEFKTGMYFIHILTGTERSVEKLIKM
jgi:hypothetical protein